MDCVKKSVCVCVYSIYLIDFWTVFLSSSNNEDLPNVQEDVTKTAVLPRPETIYFKIIIK